MTSKEIAEKYVYGRHNALTDNQEIIDMTEDINNLIKSKCQELLEIVAEKAKVKVSQHCFELSEEVDKDSILNAVDLDSFIS